VALQTILFTESTLTATEGMLPFGARNDGAYGCSPGTRRLESHRRSAIQGSGHLQKQQRTLFDHIEPVAPGLKTSRSGTFIDNMSLPVHRWFRYSAGFAAQWVEQTLMNWSIRPGQVVLDPFVGSGTVPIVCDCLGVRSLGIEAHPVVARICKAKTFWNTDPCQVHRFADEVIRRAQDCVPDISSYAPLIHRSFVPEWLATLDQLKSAWISLKNASPESELVWLALTSILRPSSRAGTAQWQYILPNKTKKSVVHPLTAFQQQIEVIKTDLRWMKARAERSCAEVVTGDARTFALSVQDQVDAVITSPPYANNYDYADAIRFEMTFWGDVAGWGDIHEGVTAIPPLRVSRFRGKRSMC
jgi:hypothetical protein